MSNLSQRLAELNPPEVTPPKSIFRKFREGATVVDKSEFGGVATEEDIVAYFLNFPDQFARYSAHLRPEIFKSIEARFLFTILKQGFEHHGTIPTGRILRDLVSKMLYISDPYKEVLALVDSQLDPRDIPYIREHLEDWLEFRIGHLLYSDEVIDAAERGEFAMHRRIVEEQAMVRLASPRYIDAKEFFSSQYSLDYLIPHLLVAGQPCLIGGAQKSLKTSVALDLAISLAVKGTFLGRFPVTERQRVLFLSAESGTAKLQQTALRICEAANIDPHDLCEYLTVRTEPFSFADTGAVAAFKKDVEKYDYQVIIIDPVYLCMDGENAGNLFSMGTQLGAVSKACAGRTLILVHHTKQVQQRFLPPQLEDLSWAGFKEFARQWILVGRRSEYVPGTGLHELHMTVGGSAGHGGHYQLDIDDGASSGRWATEFVD